MKKLILTTLLAVMAIGSHAQSIREEIKSDPYKAGGLYYPYPGPQKSMTAVPKGFKPFYISHLGRHGSRWLTNSECYEFTSQTMSAALEAGKLTDFGKDVCSRVLAAADDAKGNVEQLTPLGVSQHKGIAGRMARSFPEVFGKGAVVTANSTQSPRVIMSMFSFCDKLHEINPSLNIDVNASVRDEEFVANRSSESRAFSQTDAWYAGLDAFRQRHVHPERLMKALFSDPQYVKDSVDTEKLYQFLFELFGIMPDCPADIRFDDLFTVDELYDMWQVGNYEYYSAKGSNPKGGEALVRAALPMLQDIIDKADDYIGSGRHGASLRFSHDSYLVPLSVCMQLDGCRGRETDPEKYPEAFANYKISPMGGNVQMIFFKNRRDEVIVKFMLNENEVGIPARTDMYPYYRWEDVKAFYGSRYHIERYGYDRSIEYNAGLLMPYPEPEEVLYTPAPQGYKPFYIGHFGRHGSRWHTRSNIYRDPVDILSRARSAEKLTYLGEDVLERVKALAEDADRRSGELTPLGFRQHAGIASRMFSNYPEVFKGNRHISAHSTTSPRVMLSMNSFCETLKGLNPDLDIWMDTGSAVKIHTSKLTKEASAYKKNASWAPALRAYEDEMYKPERLMASLFSDSLYVRDSVDSRHLMDCLYELSSIALDTELDIRLYDIFEAQELKDIWKTKNYSYYMQKGPAAAGGDTTLLAASPLVLDFIQEADKAIAGGQDAATLRFSHDSYLAPLTTAFQFGGCRESTDDPEQAALVWGTSSVTPMAGNVQMILYRNKKDDVIVKFLHNEREVDIPADTDIYPYYHWADVRQYYNKTLHLGLDE